MQVRKVSGQGPGYELLDDKGKAVPVVTGFLAFLHARGCSPNTIAAYAHDLIRFWTFLADRNLTWQRFRAADSLAFLEHLRAATSSRPTQRLSYAVVAGQDGMFALPLSPSTINRILTTVSTFYEYLILSDQLGRENPMEKRPDPAYTRVTNRHRSFLDHTSRQRPLRRSVRVKTVRRLPRPLDDEQVEALLAALRRGRDRALVLLMLHGGLRTGEVLGLHLEDIAYGRRRVTIRFRTDHPKGVREKSRSERVVDIHDPTTLACVSDYVMRERPTDVETPYVFLVGGRGRRRAEPLGYDALAKLFARAAARAGIRQPWITPQALRHTHATRMWEGGMRELTLQRRLGHASLESTRVYTQVSDPQVVADYRKAMGMKSA